ncbi:hypothetical protein HUG10_20335 (plasmid) [Halorarum halophilum]|uniref:D-isomer specific 2-hydroxyacid dehydrogenase NAD-binding domain-containing protein n=1 Tax=Halorarum halophilum TaxID=2743090 RepID=A0A7D5GII7_9EURY|nr:NAD(P)-dependent oxidoreductase [Halobaculum halophilum]QLG29950.1 hypothetical protein HUG10_20335 [Halobaculum halophilum]
MRVKGGPLTLHVRLSNDTEGMMGHKEFERMKSSAYLINTSRGGLVNEETLVRTLDNGELGGAALGVPGGATPPEPPLARPRLGGADAARRRIDLE